MLSVTIAVISLGDINCANCEFVSIRSSRGSIVTTLSQGLDGMLSQEEIDALTGGGGASSDDTSAQGDELLSEAERDATHHQVCNNLNIMFL